MRIQVDKLEDPNKHYYWVEEYWPGFSPALSYRNQADALRRYADSLGYIERGWQDGKIVMMFQLADRNGLIYLVAANTPEEFSSFIKESDGIARLPPDCRRVMSMSHWDAGKDAFLQMIARLTVRASYELKGLAQPTEQTLHAEALQWRADGKLDPLFKRLADS